MFDRLLHDPSYDYSPVTFELGKILNNDDIKFISEGDDSSTHGAKSVHMHEDIYMDFEPGRYFVRINVKWKNVKYNKAVLAIYAQEKVEIKQLPIPQGKF